MVVLWVSSRDGDVALFAALFVVLGTSDVAWLGVLLVALRGSDVAPFVASLGASELNELTPGWPKQGINRGA